MTSHLDERAPSALSDQPARERIVADLDTNMLVEAGAGSGKTTSLVDRMVALVARGTPVEAIAAVTFTRKAANELRERFQVRLELRLREAPAGSDLAKRYDSALREMDRAFLGTIHSFCGRLLHERPLEVALDPNFQELSEDDWVELRASFWRRWIARAKQDNDSQLGELVRVGVDPFVLSQGFESILNYPDVDFPTGNTAKPDTAQCKRALTALLLNARKLMPKEKPADGWDKLMRLVIRLHNNRGQNSDWSSDVGFFRAIETISDSQCDLVQKRWSGTKEGKVEAKALSEDFRALIAGPLAEVLRLWREHRYPLVMRVLLRAASDFEKERHATGQLGFEDLLLLAAKLLREHPGVRDELGSRFAHLLVDEFQDTDPIQAEVCFLLASPSTQGNDWRTAVPRPGSLFVVGDPKQSIYRFRRADIQTYDFVKQRLMACGVVLSLTRNFRSVGAIGTVVNGYFERVFPENATAVQAPYSAMQTTVEQKPSDGVFFYAVCPAERNSDSVIEQDATKVASWIAERIESGARVAQDFLVLTYAKRLIASYARALGERNIGVVTTGATLPQEHELGELLVVLSALADPDNEILVVAALEGLFFGLSPADLFEARQSKMRFEITRPTEPTDPVGRALRVMHEWWELTQRHSADVVIERILAETGLLYHAASQPLGDARAGALLHLVESLRMAASGASAITDAMDRIQALLIAEAADAPLRPGRIDAVRVMNLHKAKGLEAEVVILAGPLDADIRPAIVHVQRGELGRPTGGILIQFKESEGGKSSLTIAHPPGWAEMQARETEFLSAERSRLLYVAATRAKRELVVARCERWKNKGKDPVPDDSVWSPLAPTLETLGSRIDLPENPAPGRRHLDREPSSIQNATTEAGDRMRAASTASTRTITVTESAKQEFEDRRTYDLPKGGAGAAWGRAVHRTLEGMGRGRTGENLRAFISAVVRDEDLPDERGEELEKLSSEVALSDAWRDMMSHGTPHFELSIMLREHKEDMEVITEGVIDIAAANGAGWLVLDWKSDVVDDSTWRARKDKYDRQVGQYAQILSSLTGLPAQARIERVRARSY